MTGGTVRTAVLLAATITSGLMAGVSGLYAHTIMRGLGRTDDRTFVAGFGAIDRAIINPLFLSTYLGALVFGATASAMSFREGGRPVLPWVLCATGLYLLTVIITFAVHLPCNDNIKAAGRLDHTTDVAQLRADFHESRWRKWNIVRAVATTVAFACLAWALVLDGRVSTKPDATAATPGPHPYQPVTWPMGPRASGQ